MGGRKTGDPGERKKGGGGALPLAETGKEPPAVKIKEHDVAWRGALEPFAGDTAEMSGRDLDYWRNFVGIGVKDFARDAKISHAFQTAFDPPFCDPHRKMRLKAGH